MRCQGEPSQTQRGRLRGGGALSPRRCGHSGVGVVGAGSWDFLRTRSSWESGAGEAGLASSGSLGAWGAAGSGASWPGSPHPARIPAVPPPLPSASLGGDQELPLRVRPRLPARV